MVFGVLATASPASVVTAMRRRREDHHFAVLEEDHLAGVGEHGRDVGGDEILTVPLADHQRRALLGGNQLVRFVGAEDRHGIGTAHLAQGLPHR